MNNEKKNILSLVNRTREVFRDDFNAHIEHIVDFSDKRVLVVGGAGSIGSSVVEYLFQSGPAALHVVDTNENALADLVRHLRSSYGYTTKDFQTICFDPLHKESDELIRMNGPYHIILNFAAIKHVRSEKDPYTLSRMFAVNVQLMKRLTEWSLHCEAETLFSVSTDKAANPANIMGASKRLMEMVGFAYGSGRFSTARFANVAFSNGSLLNAFWDRLNRGQPLSAPSNIKRFFISHEEAARLCLIEALAGPKGTIAIPQVPGEIELTSFVDVAINVLASRGYKPLLCETEDEARQTHPPTACGRVTFLKATPQAKNRMKSLSQMVKNLSLHRFEKSEWFGTRVEPSRDALERALAIDPIAMSKEEVINRVADVVPGFAHVETGKNLDQRM